MASAASQGAGGGRAIPQALIVCTVGGARTTFPLRLGFATTTEALKEECMVALRQRCRDDGVPFTPPSNDPRDYDLCPCRPDGTLLPHYGPLAGEQEGAPPVRMQMPRLPTPLLLSFDAGLAWRQRQEVLGHEAAMRAAIWQLYTDGIARLRFVAAVHEERMLDYQTLRASQEQLALPIEAMMVELYAAYAAYTRQVCGEQKALAGMHERFAAAAVPAAEALLKATVSEMNAFYRASCIKVKTYVFAGSRVGGE